MDWLRFHEHLGGAVSDGRRKFQANRKSESRCQKFPLWQESKKCRCYRCTKSWGFRSENKKEVKKNDDCRKADDMQRRRVADGKKWDD